MAIPLSSCDISTIGSPDRSGRTVERLFRYPVKGFTPEELDDVALEPGRGLEWDRAVAITDGTWHYDEASYTPLFKDKFIALLTHPGVAAFRLSADLEAKHVNVVTPDGVDFPVDLSSPGSGEGFIDYLVDYLDLPAGQRPQIVRRGHGSFTDLSALDSEGAYDGTVSTAISLMNLATVRELAQKMDDPHFDIRRLRANLYFDSDRAWEEADWVGRYVRVGSMIGKVVLSIPRCMVTAVNPDTGERDRGVVQALLKNYRSKDLGIYVDVVEPGQVNIGDQIEVVDYPHDTHELVQVPFRGGTIAIHVRKSDARSEMR